MSINVDRVTFGNAEAKAVVTQATEGAIKVVVPPKATTGPISITSTGGSATSADLFTVAPGEDFGLTLVPATIQIPMQGYGLTRIKLNSVGLNDYAQIANLTITGLPSGMGYSLQAPNVYLNQDVLLTLTTDGTVSTGSYAITVSAQGNSDVTVITRGKTLTVQVLEAGATTVSGRILHGTDDAEPFPGVRIRLGTQETLTDATGSYRFISPTVLGDQVVLIDGDVANTPEAHYPSAIPMPVMIVAGQDNPVITSYLSAIDPTRFRNITPGSAASVQFPDLPGYELRIPDNTVLYGWDGNPIDKINVRRGQIDKVPVRPMPNGLKPKSVYLYYFFRAGGANPTQPIPVTMRNDIDLLPGQKAQMWYYDESPVPDPTSNQWRMMGLGTVSADGQSIVSDPGVGIPKFCCGVSTVVPTPADSLRADPPR